MTSLAKTADPSASGRGADEARWDAVRRRDADADGTFVYSVRTTGVYCRPSCKARPARRENVRFHTGTAEAERAGFRPCKRCRPNQAAAEGRVAATAWQRIGDELDRDGWSTIAALLSAEECRSLTESYADDGLFRKRIDMARHGYGQGAYKYFAYPLPDIVAALRATLYPPLAGIANRWSEETGLEASFPSEHAAFVERCHRDGQTRPTPLMLRYGEGDYNRLHQDLYGVHVFPLQVTVLLSAPGRDFSGGEFVLTEQRPRMQSRAEIVPLDRGDAVIFPVRHRPVRGARGIHRVTMRHGVSRVRGGTRLTLGIIFHDAA